MATITLDFEGISINTSVQVGDTAYFCSTTTNSGFLQNDVDIVEIGIIKSINVDVIEVTANDVTIAIPDECYILFSKDNAVNMSSPIGYYSLIQFKNDSTVKSEIFSVGCETFTSSK